MFLTIKFEISSIFGVLFSGIFLNLNGNIITIAGRSVIENSQAAPTPNAEKLPKSLKGGASEKLRLRKPIIVVRLVRKTGPKLILIDSIRACFFSSPFLKFFIVVVKI